MSPGTGNPGTGNPLGPVGPVNSVGTVEDLRASAARRAGLADFGPDDYTDGLAVLLDSYDRDAGLTPLGAKMQRVFLRGALTEAGLLTESNGTSIDAALSTARARAVAVARDPATSTDSLEHVWKQLAADLERSAGPGVRALMEASHTKHMADRR